MLGDDEDGHGQITFASLRSFWTRTPACRFAGSSNLKVTSRGAMSTLTGHFGTLGICFLIFETVWSFTWSGPRPIDRPQGLAAKRADIERQVGDQDVVAVEYQAVRPEKTDGRTVLVDPAEVAELGDHPALFRLEHHDLVGLVARDPEVVVLVDDQAVRPAAGTVDEDLRRAGLQRRAAHRDLHDRVVRRVGDEQRRLLVVERQAVRADGGRRPRRLEERALDPGGRLAAVLARPSR